MTEATETYRTWRVEIIGGKDYMVVTSWKTRPKQKFYDLFTTLGWRNVLADLRAGLWAQPWRHWWRDTLARFSPRGAK